MSDAPENLATPEGDNEQLPDQPLNPNEPAAERPRGDQPHSAEPLYPTDPGSPPLQSRVPQA